MSKTLTLLAVSALALLTTTDAQFFRGGYGGGLQPSFSTGYSNGYTNTGYGNTGYGNTGYNNNNGYTNTGYTNNNGYTNTHNGYNTNNGYNTGYGNSNTYGHNGYSNTGYGNTNHNNYGIRAGNTNTNGNTRAPVNSSVEVPIRPLTYREPHFDRDSRGRVMHYFSAEDGTEDIFTDDEAEWEDDDDDDDHVDLETDEIQDIDDKFFEIDEEEDDHRDIDHEKTENLKHAKRHLKSKLLSLEKYNMFLEDMIARKEIYLHTLDRVIHKKEKALHKLDTKEAEKRAKLDTEIAELIALKEKLDKEDKKEAKKWAKLEEKRDERHRKLHKKCIKRRMNSETDPTTPAHPGATCGFAPFAPSEEFEGFPEHHEQDGRTVNTMQFNHPYPGHLTNVIGDPYNTVHYNNPAGMDYDRLISNGQPSMSVPRYSSTVSPTNPFSDPTTESMTPTPGINLHTTDIPISNRYRNLLNYNARFANRHNRLQYRFAPPSFLF